MNNAMSEPDARPKLSDPTNCGEDHVYNLSRVTAIAKVHCGDCENYHITTPVFRLTGRCAWNEGARTVLTGFVQSFLAGRTPSGDPIEIVIAGAADTSILASCAHAANFATNGNLEDVRFTVLDKCGTPLELCRDFAQLHGLKVDAFAADLTRLVRAYPADVIVLHSVLAFIPQSCHAALLRECGRWLKPGGRIFLWNSITPEHGPRAKHSRIEVSNRMRAMIKAEAVTINEPIAQFIGRLDHLIEVPRGIHRIASTAAVHHLLAEVGLPVISAETFNLVRTVPDQPSMIRPHMLAVLGPPNAN